MKLKKTRTAKNAPDAVLNAAKAARTFLSKGIELSATDTMSLIVEPTLEALGWDPKDPTQVRRQSSSIQLAADEQITVAVTAINQPIAKSAGRQARTTDGWIILTNGIEWNIFNSRKPGFVFRSASFETPAKAKKTLEVLRMFRPAALSSGTLNRKWTEETFDQDVAEALAAHLRGGEEMFAAVRANLSESGVRFLVGDLKKALRRLTVQISTHDTHSQFTPQGPDDAPSKNTKVASEAKSSPAKKVAAKSAPKSKDPVISGSQEWPEEATHCMRRKKNVAYINLNPMIGTATLMPGSVIVAAPGKALGKQMVDARAEAAADGKLKRKGKLFLVVEPIEFSNPRLAATFAAGTLVKDITAWLDRDGTALDKDFVTNIAARAASAKPAKTPAKKKPAAKTPTKGKKKPKAKRGRVVTKVANANVTPDAAPAEVAEAPEAKPQEKEVAISEA
jgi:hypothetical protein